MAKKKTGKKTNQWLDQQETEVKKEVEQFYPDGTRVETVDLTDQSAFDEVISAMRTDISPPSITVQQIHEKCLVIREKVKAGRPDNIEINLMQRAQRFQGHLYELGDTVIKARAFDNEVLAYLHLKKGDTSDALIFLGGDDVQAFLVTRNAENEEVYIRLSEFHLLSISESSKPGREVGLLTSYSWLAAKLYTNIIMGASLNPVKNLFLADVFQMKSGEAKIERPQEDTDENTQ